MNFIKTIKSILISSSVILGLACASQNVFAQEITAINFNGEPLGKVIPDGKVVGFDNDLLGSITADSLLINSSGALIGGVVPQGVAIGNDTKILGKVGSDGSIRGGTGQVVGRALPNGLVINDNYEIIGRVIFSGLVYNDEGVVSGRVTGDGLYTSINGEQIGIVMPDGYAYKKIGNDYILDGRLISSKMVVSTTGDFIGSVVPGGQVTDFDSVEIGAIRANGFAYGNGLVIGKIVNSGYAIGDEGNYIGFVSYNGEVIKDNTVVGKVRADGLVSDIKGSVIGKSVDFSATAVDTKGRYLGRLLPDGKIVKMSTEVGKIGPKGTVLTSSGVIIGKIVKAGPVYDYKGELKGHALSNGSVIALSGTTIGYIIGKDAYSLSGAYIGSVLDTKAVYDQNNSFIGISGISSSLANKGERISVSPLGYVFSSSGDVVGKAKDIDTFYTPYGAVLGYQGLNGKVVNQSNAETASVIGLGYALNAQNALVGKSTNVFTAVDYLGKNLGLINDKNILYNEANSTAGKILPDGSVSAIKAGNLNYMPKIGQAYGQKNALDFKGGFLGYVDDFGVVNNFSGVKVGQVVTQNLVIDNSGLPVGFVADLRGVTGDNCETIGVVSGDGLVYNYRGIYIGRLLANSYVISDGGVVLGKAQENNPIINYNGRIVGYTAYNGKVISEQNTEMGCLNVKGLLKSSDGSILGGIINSAPIIDYDGKVSSYSTLAGLSVNSNNEFTGYQQPNGNINSNSGISIGYLFKYKFAFGDDNNLLGYVTEDGRVINSRKEEVGKVDFDGYVVSNIGKIGYALYDIYVYDKNDMPVGIINPLGEVVSFSNQSLGFLNKGFVLKNKEVYARGLRDYNIRNKERSVIGEIHLDGSVTDEKGIVVGKLAENGKIVDDAGVTLAFATPLQYYDSNQTSRQIIYDEDGNPLGYLDDKGELVDASGNVIGKIDESGNIIGLDGEKIAEVTEGKKVYGANGEVLGTVDANGNVFDENGNLVGKLNEKGELVDSNSNVIGKIGDDSHQEATAENIVPSGEEVYDSKGNLLGKTDANGNVVDANGSIIGKVNENGELVDAGGNVIGKIGNWFNQSDIITSIGAIPEVSEDEDPLAAMTSKRSGRSLGIALTPDGELLGEILEDGTVVDEEGNIIGYRTPDGLIIDEDGELIGTDDSEYLSDEGEYDEDGGSKTSQAPFIPAGSFGPGGAYGIGAGSPGDLGPGGGYGPGERYDPARQAALNAAQQQRRSNMSVGKISSNISKDSFDGYQKDWSEQGIGKSISSWRVDMSEMIFSDKPIPAVIARAIDTNNPAPITAYVERNVYAEEGRNIIIPAGSRLIGAFGSITASAEATSESARVQITWERLIRPDGSIFVFSGQTADAQGRAGALGYVDQQLFKKYTLPVVTTVLTSAASFFMASADDNAGDIENSKQQAASDARQNFLDDMESLFDDILADKTDVKAMTYVPAGTRIIIYPNTDLWLRSDERAADEAAKKREKPEVFINDAQLEVDEKRREREDTAKGQASTVVYNPDDAGVEEAKPSTPPLIANSAPAEKTGATIAPPPPPSGGIVSAPPGAAMSTNDSIPALF